MLCPDACPAPASDIFEEARRLQDPSPGTMPRHSGDNLAHHFFTAQRRKPSRGPAAVSKQRGHRDDKSERRLPHAGEVAAEFLPPLAVFIAMHMHKPTATCQTYYKQAKTGSASAKSLCSCWNTRGGSMLLANQRLGGGMALEAKQAAPRRRKTYGARRPCSRQHPAVYNDAQDRFMLLRCPPPGLDS